MQKRFTRIVNHLASLGKIFSNEDLINKVLRCLSRQWQPKVTAIAESRNTLHFTSLRYDQIRLLSSLQTPKRLLCHILVTWSIVIRTIIFLSLQLSTSPTILNSLSTLDLRCLHYSQFFYYILRIL